MIWCSTLLPYPVMGSIQHDPFKNGQISASVSRPELKETEIRSRHCHKIPKPQAGTALEMTAVYTNLVRVPGFAGNQSEPEDGTDFGNLLPVFTGNLQDSVIFSHVFNLGIFGLDWRCSSFLANCLDSL